MTSTKQMKKYNVTMNFTKLYQALKPYMLREYKPIPSIDKDKKKIYVCQFSMTAKSPDDACFLSMKNLISLLRDQDVPEPIVRDVKNIVSIKNLEEAND